MDSDIRASTASGGAPAASHATERRSEERAERQAFFRAAARITPIVAAKTKSGTFLVRTSDEVVGRALFVKRARGEMRTLRLALATLETAGVDPRRDGRALLDVGANLGTTCIPALQRYGFERAIAIEPAPENYRLLRANLCLNGLEELVRTFPLALSDAEGEAELVLNPINSGDHRTALPEREATGRRIRVPRTTVDALAERGEIDPEAIGLLWIDAQGHEGHILAGARRLLGIGVPAVVELWPDELAANGGLDRYLDLLGAFYTHVVDLDEPGGGTPRAVAELPGIARARAGSVTDLLMVRSP
jgi:FkbM family methyltransferase